MQTGHAEVLEAVVDIFGKIAVALAAKSKETNIVKLSKLDNEIAEMYSEIAKLRPKLEQIIKTVRRDNRNIKLV